MEALERWSVHYPELEALSETMKTLQASLRAFGEPSPAASQAQVQSTIAADIAVVQQELAELRNNSEPLRQTLNNVPLDSLTSLHKHLQNEVQQNSIGAGGEQLVQNLQGFLENSSTGAPSSTNNLFEAWVLEFVREPLDELFEHAKQIVVSTEMNMAMEHGILKQIRSLSEQICQPGYRSDRVELMDTRSVLVQQLLTALGAKQRALGMAEPKTGVLDRKRQAFEQGRISVLRAHREEVAKHIEISEELARKAQTMEKYIQQKERVYELEDKAAEGRRQQRAQKFRRISESLQESFSSILETIEQCRHDKSRVIQAQLEQQQAAEAVKEINNHIVELQELYTAANRHTDEAEALEQGFANWISEAYAVMRQQAIKHYESLQKMFATDKARMLALSHTMVEHVQVQREQVGRALEQKTSELTSCQDAVSMMEFSKPGSEEVANKLNQLEAVQEAVKWQQHEVDALTQVEERISHDVTELMGAETANSLEANRDPEGKIERSTVTSKDVEAAGAQQWVSEFFYTWQQDLACQPKRAPTQEQQREPREWRFSQQSWLRAGSPQQLVDAVTSSTGADDVDGTMNNVSTTDLNGTSESLSPGLLQSVASQQQMSSQLPPAIPQLSLPLKSRTLSGQSRTSPRSKAMAVDVCNDLSVGDLVSARWARTGQFYVAVIASDNNDGTVTVNWQDGRKEFRTVPKTEVRKDITIAQTPQSMAISSSAPPPPVNGPVVHRFASDGSVTTTSTLASPTRAVLSSIDGSDNGVFVSSSRHRSSPRGRSSSTAWLVPNVAASRQPTPTKPGSKQSAPQLLSTGSLPKMQASGLPTVPLPGASVANSHGTATSVRPLGSVSSSTVALGTMPYGLPSTIGATTFVSTAWGTPSKATTLSAPPTVIRSSSLPAGKLQARVLQTSSLAQVSTTTNTQSV